MAKMTLLEMTQDILSDMDSDEVNSINTTPESLQVAQIIKTSYYNIVDGTDYPFLYELFRMNTSGTSDRPTHMTLPDTVVDLKWIKYNTKKLAGDKDLYKSVVYKTPEDFMQIVDQRDSTDTNIKVVTDSTGISINVFKNKQPQCFTSFDDESLVFDSYLSSLETNLQNSKTQCWGKRSVAFTLSDTFIPDIPVQLFSYLLAEAKSTAFVVLKQMANPKAEQTATSQRRRMSQDAWRLKNGISYPNYGRHGSTNKKPNY
jgi:hypothetical protein|tara:strand:- start:11803 stop:12579 length:777 start_codon:yes stop_codon:yes gene_type:complete